jgi:hypothetical protein
MPLGKSPRHRPRDWAAILAAALLLTACAAKRPVLYPNDQLLAVNPEVAQADIDQCLAMARAHGAETDAGGRVARNTAGGAVLGGATGAAAGAVLGSVGRGAGAGAAAGAAGGLVRGLFTAPEPDPVFRNFVERCLRDKGYEPIGWK